MTRTIFDIETNGLLPHCDKLYCLVCRDADTGATHSYGPGRLADGIQHLLSSDEIIGHNIIAFDIPALKHLGYLPDNQQLPKVTDTLVLSRLIHTTIGDTDREHLIKDEDYMPRKTQGSHSLRAWGYRLGELKGNFGEELGFEEYSPEMLKYCEQDVLVSHHLYDSLIAEGWDQQCIDLEHEFAHVIQQMEQHGFAFDLPKAHELYVTLSTRKLALLDSLKAMFPDDKVPMKSHLWRTVDGALFPTKKAAKASGFKEAEIERGPLKLKLVPFNPASRDHIGDRLQRLGWVPTIFTSEGKPKIDESILLGIQLNEKQEAVELLNEFLMIGKRMGQLAEGQQAWLKLEVKGRIHGRVQTNGTVTGRCSHSTPNVAQVPRVGNPFGLECRSLFRASEGKALIGCDASGLELRCLAHYMHPYDNGEYARKVLKEDIHTVNQTAAGLPTRDAAKTFIYAFLYGAGDAKIGRDILGRGPRAGKQIKQKFLKSLPALAQLKNCITNKLASNNYLRGLDGRLVYIRSEHAGLNFLLQSAGAIAMKQATVNLYHDLTKEGLVHGVDWAMVAHVHDEFQVETSPDHVPLIKQRAINAIRSAGETLGFRCPLDGEAKSGANWAETH